MSTNPKWYKAMADAEKRDKMVELLQRKATLSRELADTAESMVRQLKLVSMDPDFFIEHGEHIIVHSVRNVGSRMFMQWKDYILDITAKDKDTGKARGSLEFPLVDVPAELWPADVLLQYERHQARTKKNHATKVMPRA